MRLIRERVQRLMTIAGVGEVTALTWALEIGDPLRFGSIRQAISYCGLCSAQRESAGKEHRGPISKKAQQTSPNHPGRGRQDCPALESAIGRRA